MCGIACVIHANEAAALAAVSAMNDAQAHRGPDGEGTRLLRAPGRAVALGHRRLAIQDVSPAGQQPMENPATGDVIVYNGEIYNVGELRAELRSSGFEFRSRSDTEVVLAAFARWGIACVDRMMGMFAFALWAVRERKVYLARDPLGIKPLYWTSTQEGGIAVASELRAIVASGLADARIDTQAARSLLAYGAVAQPRTMFEGVRLLEPGTWAVIDPASREERLSLRAQRYWEFGANPRIEWSRRRVGEELRPILSASVRSHLVSDVPVAVFLSGGIDSSAIAALAREEREIDTFTVRLSEDATIDEAPVALDTARLLGTRHHEISLREREALELVTKWFSRIDQPSVDGLNTFVIAQAARQRGIVVALSGLGGDEMFGGYGTFRQVPALAHVGALARGIPRSVIAGPLARLWEHSGSRREKLEDLLGVEASPAALSLWRRRLMSNAQMRSLGLAEGTDTFLPPECDIAYGVPSSSSWAAVRAMETRFYMGNMLLRDADVFGMAHGLEIRVPLLDRRVVDLALTYARPALDARRRPNKPWLVAAVGSRIPPGVLRLSKRGFSLPQARWMRGALRDAFEARIDTVATSGLLDERGVRQIWSAFLRESDGPSWSRAWMLGVMGDWLARTKYPKPTAGAQAWAAASA